MTNPEQLKSGNEKLVDVSESSEQSAERLKESLEKRPVESSEHRQERLRSARKETETVFARESGRERKSGGEPSSPQYRLGKATSKQKDKAYRETLRQAQSHMSPPRRTFSKVIHIPVVEKTSDAVGSTLARPNAILMGGLTSLLVVGGVYLIAKYYGYSLSGSETIIAFGLGWVLGLIIDYAQLLLRGHKS